MGSSMTVRQLVGCHCTCALINWSVLRHNNTCENTNAAAGGAFLSLTIAQATTLVEKMASNQGWNEERLQTHKRGGGIY